MRGAPPPRKPLPVFPDPDEEDPFAEEALRPVLRTEDKILSALRRQLCAGLLSLADYEKAARNAVAVLSSEEAEAAALPGHTLRIVFTNERRQFESGLISEAEFARLKKAAVMSKSASSPASPGRDNAQVSGTAASASNRSPRGISVTKESPREKKASPRRLPPPPPSTSPPPPPVRGTTDSYVPFIPSKSVAQGFAATQLGISDAISLDLSCSVVGTTKVERRNYLGVVKPKLAFQILVRGKEDVKFEVVRRYGECLKLFESISEFWPDLTWPRLPRKGQFSDGDAERLGVLVNAFLAAVTSSKAVARSQLFMRFIDPKSNPLLGVLMDGSAVGSFGMQIKAGWIKLRKSKTLAQMRRMWAVLTSSNMLYFFLSNRDRAAEPFVTISLELCKVDLMWIPQLNANVLELDRFCVGKKYWAKPDDAPSEWMVQMRKVAASYIHVAILPMMSEEDAKALSDNRNEMVRRESIGKFCKALIVGSQNKETILQAFYEKDSVDKNVVFRNSLIKCATKFKLVEYLLNHLISPPSVVSSFLLTFHSFMRCDELLDQLLSYFKKPPSISKKSTPGSTGSTDQFLPEQLRVISILQKWLFLCPRDFAQDQLLRESLNSFAEKNKFAHLLKPRRGGNADVTKSEPLKRSSNVFQRSSSRKDSDLSRSRNSIVLGGSRATASSSNTSSGGGGAGETSSSDTVRSRPRSNSFDTLKKGGSAGANKAVPKPPPKVVVDASGTVRITTVNPSARRALPDFSKPTGPSPSSKIGTVKSHGRRNSSDKIVVYKVEKMPALLPFGFVGERKMPWDLFCIVPSEVGKQISVYQQRLFVQIAPFELIGQRWNKAEKLVESPNVCWLIEQFNILSGTVSSSIVGVEDPESRAGMIVWWIQVASECFGHNDFSSTMAIVSGLLNTSVYRLDRTWRLVKKKHQTFHAKFETLVSASNSEKNYSSLRASYRSATPPMLPYLGVFLQDLTFCEDAQKDFVGPDMINFEKKVQLASIVQTILLYQSVLYPFTPVEEIQLYLARFVPLNSEKLYGRSLILEPR